MELKEDKRGEGKGIRSEGEIRKDIKDRTEYLTYDIASNHKEETLFRTVVRRVFSSFLRKTEYTSRISEQYRAIRKLVEEETRTKVSDKGFMDYLIKGEMIGK